MDIIILIGITIEEDMVRNCSRDDLDLILRSMLFVTKSLITGTHNQHAVICVHAYVRTCVQRMGNLRTKSAYTSLRTDGYFAYHNLCTIISKQKDKAEVT